MESDRNYRETRYIYSWKFSASAMCKKLNYCVGQVNPAFISWVLSLGYKVAVTSVLLTLRLLPHIKGNVGFVFTKEELTDVRDLILANKVAAPAKAGAIAPIDVFVPKGNTGLGPEKTSFFQALAIPTKIAKGTIEILVSFIIFWLVINKCCSSQYFWKAIRLLNQVWRSNFPKLWY